MKTIHFTLNGSQVTAETEPAVRLLDLLRNTFHLTGTKEGCGQGECGACTVIMDGQAVNSCLVLAGQLEGSEVLTIEGLEKDGVLDVVQEAFVEEGAIQCGYCTPGMIMSVKALLMRVPNPTLEEIKEAIEGNICRCTGFHKILEAVHTAVQKEGLHE